MEIKYYLNGVNLKTTYGLVVSGSKGVIDSPKLKKPFTIDIPNKHGEVVDLTKVYYQPKTIQLDCFVSESSNQALAEKIITLKALLISQNLHRLMITIDDPVTKPLVYDVYMEEGITVEKDWKEGGIVVGKFTLKLIEPMPYKKVLKIITTTTPQTYSLTFTTGKSIEIHWGDNSVSYYVDASITHAYATAGTYYIIIVGDIDDFTISNLGGATIVWERFI